MTFKITKSINSQVKVISEEFKTFDIKSWQNTVKSDYVDIADYLRNEFPAKLQERIDYLRENHTGTFEIEESEQPVARWQNVNDNFTQDEPYYNELGNEIKFWNIIGTKTDNRIEMKMRTHDYIVGDGNRDGVLAGWGDDVLIGMSDPDHEWHLLHGDAHGSFWGEAGQDTIFVNKRASAVGGDGNDVLVGHGSSRLWGEDDNDKFVVYTKATEVGYVADLTHQDQMIIRFSETEGEAITFGGIAPIDDSIYEGASMSVIDSRGDSVAEFRFGASGIDLSEFDVTVNNAGAELVITGSDYMQRVLTTGMEMI